MKKLIKIFWIAEFILAMLMILGIVGPEAAYIFLAILVAGILQFSNLEALQLYILTIPIFVSLPSSFVSDAMSVWRIALIFFVLKVFLEKFQAVSALGDANLSFDEKKQRLSEEFSSFIKEVKAANYYKTLVPAVLFAAIGLLSLLFAQSIGAGIKKMIFLGNIVLLFSIVYFAVKSREDAMKILRSIFASAVFILMVGYFQLAATFFVNLYDFWGLWDNYVISAFYGGKMMQLLSYSNTWFSYYGSDEIPPTLRMFSVMPDSHSFSMLMILFVPITLFYAFSSRDKSDRTKYFAIFVLMLLAIFFSGSRGAWVGWLGAVVSAFYLFMLKKFPKGLRIFKAENWIEHKKTYKTVLASVLFFVVLFPVSSFVFNKNQDSQLIRAGKVAGEEKYALLKRTWSISDMDETSNKGRMEIWKDSAASVAKHPVLGIGMGNFPLALSEKISTAKMGASAHNIYLDVAVEMGILGLAAFIALLWMICQKLFLLSQKMKDKNLRLLAGASLVYFVWISTYGIFDVVIFNDKVLMFIVLIVALLYKLEDIQDKESAA